MVGFLLLIILDYMYKKVVDLKIQICYISNILLYMKGFNYESLLYMW